MGVPFSFNMSYKGITKEAEFYSASLVIYE